MSAVIIYCPECRAEYREGFERCGECNVSLVRRLDSEAVSQDAANPLVPLTRETSFELIAELLDQLEQNEVPYAIQAGTALHLLDDPESQETEPQSWEARVWVARSRERVAREIFDELVGERRFERDSQITRRYVDATGGGESDGS